MLKVGSRVLEKKEVYHIAKVVFLFVMTVPQANQNARAKPVQTLQPRQHQQNHQIITTAHVDLVATAQVHVAVNTAFPITERKVT